MPEVTVQIRVAQLTMAWTRDANVAQMRAVLAAAAPGEVVLFPECAVTGFHRRLPEQAERQAVDAALATLATDCAARRVWALVGAPLVGPSTLNAMVVLGPDGERAVQAKVGLTPSEARFFAPGAATRRLSVAGVASAVVLCREVLDHDRLAALAGARVVFWPGYVASDGDAGDDLYAAAARLARTLDAHVIHVNWADGCNDPDRRGLGGSRWLGRDGAELWRAPADSPGAWSLSVPVIHS